VAAQINMESGFNPRAVSPAGAQGIAQFMPGTWASNAPRGSSPFDPNASLSAYTKLMGTLVSQYGGNVRNALAAYNAGPGNLRAGYGYADKILSAAGGGVSAGPSTSAGAAAAPAAPATWGTTTKTVFDQAAFDRAQKAAVLGQFLSNKASSPDLWMPTKSSLPNTNSLFTSGLVTTTMPDPANYTTAQEVLQKLAGGTTLDSHPVAKAGTGSYPVGVGQFGGKAVADWIIPILTYAKQHGWTGTVNSGYRSYADQKRIYDSGVRPAAVPGTSRHESDAFPGGAVDVSNAQQLSQILLRSPYAKVLQWAGARDPVHFSHQFGGSY
jgi:hypothetical protein